jgi:hypothetical protein
MSDEIVTIATFPYPTQAELAKIRLEAEGIECIVVNALSPLLIHPATMGGGVQVQVRAEDAERAREILAQEPEAEQQQQAGWVTDEIVCDALPHQAFTDVQEAFREIGKVTRAEVSTLTVEGTSTYRFNRVDLKVEIRPEEGGRSRLLFSAGSKRGGAGVAAKCMDRLFRALGLSPQPETEPEETDSPLT